MKKQPQSIKPGHVDGKRGDWLRRFPLNGCVWHQHMKDIKDDKGNIIRTRVVGLELVSGMEHWWLDTKIKWPELQREDWDFSSLKDTQHDWQQPWALQYEYWREWQPQTDFVRWRKGWRKEVKRLRDPVQDWIHGRFTRGEAEQNAAFSYGGRLPLWLLRDFADYFPNTPWLNIPSKKRCTLKDVPLSSGVPGSLEGSLLELKAPPPNSGGPTPIPEKLSIQHNGFISLRQPDSNNEEEKALYAEYQRKCAESLRQQREWSDPSAPGLYRGEVVKEITPGQFVGTYIIQIPWYHTDDNLKAGFAAWLRERESELGPVGCRKKFSRTGWSKPFANLNQLGALRLLRSGMTAEQARSHTERETACKKPLFERPGEWSEAKKKADKSLAGFHLGEP